MTMVYGIDTENSVTPLMVRNAIEAFMLGAHAETLEGMKGFQKFDSDEAFEEFKKQYVSVFIRGLFASTGGNYNLPTKESLIRVVEALKVYAADLRNKEFIEKNVALAMEMINLIK
ncbi:MAG: hypothetical protein WC308_04600 [archaeon]|jgi:hypothetical protein